MHQHPFLDYQKVLVVEISMAEALHRGLIFCNCTHPPNNHFDNGHCAFCKCQRFELMMANGLQLVSAENPNEKKLKELRKALSDAGDRRDSDACDRLDDQIEKLLKKMKGTT